MTLLSEMLPILFCALLAIWFSRAIIETLIGLGQIALGLLVGIFGALLYVLSYIVEPVEIAWDWMSRRWKAGKMFSGKATPAK